MTMKGPQFVSMMLGVFAIIVVVGIWYEREVEKAAQRELVRIADRRPSHVSVVRPTMFYNQDELGW